MMGFTLSRVSVHETVLRRLLIISLLAALPLASLLAQEREPEYDVQGNLDRLEAAHRASEDSTKRATGEDVEGREEWFTFQRRFPYDIIPAGARAAGIRQIQLQTERLALARQGKREATLLGASTWEQIGPYNYSGRTRAIAIDPTNPSTIFIGVASGGLWRTTNGGSSWSTTFDKQSAISVGAVAIDPVDTRTIYVGTGENTMNIDAYLGDGIFKSTDGGETWSNIGLTSVGAISKIYVAPQNHNIVYVAAARSGGGFYRSLDGGKTWERTFSQSGTVFDMSVNPKSPNLIFIGTNSSLFRSVDGGKTFQSATAGMSLGNAVRLSVAIAPSDTNKAYVLLARTNPSTGNHVGDVYLSTDRGANWTLKKSLPESFFNEQGWYDNSIAVQPTNADVVFVSGIDTYRSLDGGTTFNNSTFSYQGGVVHPDQHVLVFSPNPATPGQVYVGTDGGLFLTTNTGTNWQKVSNAVPTSQYYAMDVDQTRPYRVFGGTQDNGTHGAMDASKFAQNWSNVLSGDGFFVTVDLTDPNYVYAENYNGTPIYRINATSANTLNQRSQIDGGQIGTESGYWSTPLAMSPADRTSLFCGKSSLWKNASPRSSNSWVKLSPDTTWVKSGKKITAIGLSPFDADKMIVGTQSGDVRYSTDGGSNWKAATGVAARFVTQIRFDPVDPSTVYLTVSGFGTAHIYRSTNSGASFTSITNNLPDLPCSSIEIDPENPQHLFVGTDAGVFISLEGGTYWLPFNDGLPLAPVADLRIHRSTRSLLAATHGRSMFRVSIASPEAQPILLNPTGGQNYTTPGRVSVRWLGFTGPVRVLVSYDGGLTFDTVAVGITIDSAGFDLPFIRTTHAIVRVEQISDGKSVSSSEFTISPVANVTEVGLRGFVAEALAVRGSDLWATVRGTDSIYKLRLPLLVSKVPVVRTGIPGTIRDLDYDARRGLFYALVADADGGNAKVYTMDTNAVGTGQVTLPTTTAIGIAVTPEGLAIFSAANGGMIYTIDAANGGVIHTDGPLQGATGGARRGLVWSGNGYVQGVNGRDPLAYFTAEVQRIKMEGGAQIAEIVPVIVSSGTIPNFFGLTLNPSGGDPAQWLYYATDTSGSIFSFKANLFSVAGISSVPIAGERSSVAISEISPNPFRTSATLRFSLASRRSVNIDLYTPAGDRVAHVADGSFEAGEQSVAISAEGIASGVYYVTITSDAGDRIVRPVVIVK
jgi:photosystem II stability/assembly factor-like uncharacterized protein